MESRNPEARAVMPDAENGKEASTEQLTPEQEAQAAHWLAQIEKEAATEKPPEQEEKDKAAAELQEIFDAWLVPEKLEPLHALTTQAEAMASGLRKEAKAALATITTKMKIVGETDELLEKYQTLSKAVGMISGGLVDHTR